VVFALGTVSVEFCVYVLVMRLVGVYSRQSLGGVLSLYTDTGLFGVVCFRQSLWSYKNGRDFIDLG
jgi:hypothetical protein